jgi:hypothetical protein
VIWRDEKVRISTVAVLVFLNLKIRSDIASSLILGCVRYIPGEIGDFFPAQISRPILRLTKPPNQCVSWTLSSGVNGLACEVES